MRLLQFSKYYSPNDTPGSATADVDSGSSSGDLSKEDIVEILGDDTTGDEKIDLKEGDEEETPEGETPEGEEESPDDDITDELKDLEGPNDEQLELVAPVRRKEILKKYPTLFKDFPYLEKAYYREQQYTELLPTLDDAKQAVEKGKTLDRFETDLLSGNSENILNAVKQINPRSFYKIVDDYLPALARVDEKAYHHVIGNVIKYTIANMSHEAKRINNSGLQEAAHILNQFVFGTAEWKPPSKLTSEEKEDNTKEKELTEREQRLVQGRFEDARNGLNTRVNNALKNTIEANIDPRGSMTSYVKQNAVRDANETLERLMGQDSRFKVMMDKLWEHAFKTNFSTDSTERIRQAYLSRARTLLPEVIKRARNEALKGMGKRIKEDNGETIKGKIKGQITPGAPRSNSSGKITKAGDIPKRMSTLDFLNSD